MSLSPLAPDKNSLTLGDRVGGFRAPCGDPNRPAGEAADGLGVAAHAANAADQTPRAPFACDWLDRLAREFADGRLLLLADANPVGESCDIVVAGPHASADALNFMNRFGGVLRLAIPQARARRLRLPPMVHFQRANAETYTVSIEARHGVTTGISTHDRALTVRTALDATDDQDLVSPGHVFPVVVAEGGVRMRAGAADAAVHLLSHLGPEGSAVLFKVLDDEGRCLQAGDGDAFAQAHGLLFARLEDLVGALRAAPSRPREQAA